jgi:hypothetical protein
MRALTHPSHSVASHAKSAIWPPQQASLSAQPLICWLLADREWRCRPLYRNAPSELAHIGRFGRPRARTERRCGRLVLPDSASAMARTLTPERSASSSCVSCAPTLSRRNSDPKSTTLPRCAGPVVGSAPADALSTAVTTQILAGSTRLLQDSPSLEHATAAGSAGTLAGQTSWTPANRPGNVMSVANRQPVPPRVEPVIPESTCGRAPSRYARPVPPGPGASLVSGPPPRRPSSSTEGKISKTTHSPVSPADRPVSFKMAFLRARSSPSFATAAAAFRGFPPRAACPDPHPCPGERLLTGWTCPTLNTTEGKPYSLDMITPLRMTKLAKGMNSA